MGKTSPSPSRIIAVISAGGFQNDDHISHKAVADFYFQEDCTTFFAHFVCHQALLRRLFCQ